MIDEQARLVLAVVVPGLDFAVVLSILWVLGRQQRPRSRTLIERFLVATAIWLGITLLAGVTLLSRAGVAMDGNLRGDVLVLGIIIPSLVNAGFLVLLLTGSGRDGEES